METAVLFISLWVASVVGIHNVNKPVNDDCLCVNSEGVKENVK